MEKDRVQKIISEICDIEVENEGTVTESTKRTLNFAKLALYLEGLEERISRKKDDFDNDF